MNISLVTNTDERCGNAAYARSLFEALGDYIEDCEAPGSLSLEPLGGSAERSADVILVSWHPAKVSISADTVRQWQEQGKKVALILQNSMPMMFTDGNDILVAADLVIAHEPIEFHFGNPGSNARPPVNFKFIPHGIHRTPEPPVVLAAEPVIGTAGFPAPWKRFDLVARVAKELGVACEIFAPSFPMYDSQTIVAECRALGAGVRMEFYAEQEVIRRLAKNWVNIFWFESQSEHDLFGQTGSARMGLSANRPLIISRHHKFRTLIEKYPPDEFFSIAEDEWQVKALCAKYIEAQLRLPPGATNPLVRPRHPSTAEGWPIVAEMYWRALRALVFERKVPD